MSLGNAGHEPVVMRRIATSDDGRTTNARSSSVEVEPHLLEHGGDRLEIARVRAGDFDLAAGDGADDAPGGGLDVVAAQRVRRAAERSRRLQPDRRRADPLDARAHARQELAQLDDVRLARRVADLRRAARLRRREQRGFGAGHRRFQQIDRRAAQPLGRFQLVPLRRLDDARAHRAHRAAGASRSSAAPESRRRAARSSTRPVRPISAPISSTDPRSRPTSRGSGSNDEMSRHVIRSVVVPGALDGGAERPQQIDHHVDVADARDVPQLAGFPRQQARGDQRQRGVLVAADRDGPDSRRPP